MKKQSHGFTLVEMAIVLIIIGLLLAGVMMPLSAQVEQRRIDQTQKALNDINEAILGFAVANGRLPCPADPTVPTGTAGAGVESNTGPNNSCGVNPGVVPWAILGVTETDAWGNRFTYRVTPSLADSIAAGTVTPPASCTTIPSQASFALCSLGDNTILSAVGGTAIASNVPAVVVSYGRDGLGAYNTLGVQIAGATGDELENANGDTNFVSHNPTATFDDLLTWISPNTLMNRMVSSGKLP